MIPKLFLISAAGFSAYCLAVSYYRLFALRGGVEDLLGDIDNALFKQKHDRGAAEAEKSLLRVG